MAVNQTILLTAIPHGVAVNTDLLPVTVLVSPRLRGADRLGAFPDWLHWTRRVKEDGLTLTFRSAGELLDVAVDQELDEDFWEALFKEDTLVRSHVFDDYADRAVLSFPVRETLSALKSIYQEAGVRLALPDERGDGRRELTNRRVLESLVRGLAVHWRDDEGERRRQSNRLNRDHLDQARAPARGELDPEGLVHVPPREATNRALADPFATFHNMPTPKGPDDRTPVDPLAVPDWDTLFDFHQALSSLTAYPKLLSRLGLVLKLLLPADFVPHTPGTGFTTLSVARVSPGWDWSVEPELPELATACVHLQTPGGNLFATAPRILGKQVETGLAHVPPPSILGLLHLDPQRFGLAQVDLDGGMHKAIILAESRDPDPDQYLGPGGTPAPASHPEVFDPEATLPSLRSGGFSLYADDRALHMLSTVSASKEFNDAVESGGAQPRPFFAEDLVRGYRLDVWDSNTKAWHSLHFRDATYWADGEHEQAVGEEEGFVQLAVMQPAPGAEPETNDLYLHEVVVRWAGWSLAVEMPGLHISRDADPGAPLSEPVNEPLTPFKLTSRFDVVPESLPRLRFGWRYRFRVRAVDLAGGGLDKDGAADLLAIPFGLPLDPEGFAYLRFEPLPAPVVVIREESAITGPGSAVDRLVIRTANSHPTEDEEAADLAGSERHILPPRTTVELAERMGMFDAPSGELSSDDATWELIAERDEGDLNRVDFRVAEKDTNHPLEPGETIDPLPYLPDRLAHGAAIRDLPGSTQGAVGQAALAGGAGRIEYEALSDPNPRPGSATLIPFGAVDGDWQEALGFRLVLAEPKSSDTEVGPSWDPVDRVLTVFLPKGTTATVPLTSYLLPDELKLMGQWQWLRQYVDELAKDNPRPQHLIPGSDADRIAHVVQRAVEGGHWLLTPPRLLTLVHAVQQPLGRPEFGSLDVEFEPVEEPVPVPLQTKPSAGRLDPTELAGITAWRRPGATDAYLLGALRVHGASTDKIDLEASWVDPVDDPGPDGSTPPTEERHRGYADEIPLPGLLESYLASTGPDPRYVGYYDPEHDQIGFVREGERVGRPEHTEKVFENAAPRHVLGDTKHHRVTYTAVATSRYREYFPQDLDFTRSSEPVVVHVPSSERPLAPSVVYVVPTFGWQRQVETNLKRSVRFGGGLRVYLERPWFSSGEGELLGVALWPGTGTLDEEARDKFKGFITQWGMDPIWKTDSLFAAPNFSHFPDAVSSDRRVPLEEDTARTAGARGLVDVVGFEPRYDEERNLWFADLTVLTRTTTYMPFVRLALVRYQPDALLDAKISRVVLADFAQLTPDRSALVTCDPYHPRRLNVVVSGIAPEGPGPAPLVPPTQIKVRVQERVEGLESDLAWRDVDAAKATVVLEKDETRADIALWAGTATFTDTPAPGQFRLLVEERELIAPGEAFEGSSRGEAGRLIYIETFELDSALLASD